MKMLCREAADTHPADVEQSLTRMSRQLALAYNSASMLKLAQDDIEQAQLLLINAQTLIENSVALLPLQQRNQLTAVTYNNFACVYKRQHDLPAALKYAEQALLLERKDPSAPSPASTHLNLCAILSEMGRHTSAHEQALYALSLLVADARAGNADCNLLAVCYHNLAVEQEHLHKSPAALKSYRRALQLARSTDSALTTTVEETYNGAVSRSFRNRKQNTPEITAHALVSLPRARCQALISKLAPDTLNQAMERLNRELGLPSFLSRTDLSPPPLLSEPWQTTDDDEAFPATRSASTSPYDIATSIGDEQTRRSVSEMGHVRQNTQSSTTGRPFTALPALPQSTLASHDLMLCGLPTPRPPSTAASSPSPAMLLRPAERRVAAVYATVSTAPLPAPPFSTKRSNTAVRPRRVLALRQGRRGFKPKSVATLPKLAALAGVEALKQPAAAALTTDKDPPAPFLVPTARVLLDDAAELRKQEARFKSEEVSRTAKIDALAEQFRHRPDRVAAVRLRRLAAPALPTESGNSTEEVDNHVDNMRLLTHRNGAPIDRAEAAAIALVNAVNDAPTASQAPSPAYVIHSSLLNYRFEQYARKAIEIETGNVPEPVAPTTKSTSASPSSPTSATPALSSPTFMSNSSASFYQRASAGDSRSSSAMGSMGSMGPQPPKRAQTADSSLRRRGRRGMSLARARGVAVPALNTAALQNDDSQQNDQFDEGHDQLTERERAATARRRYREPERGSLASAGWRRQLEVRPSPAKSNTKSPGKTPTKSPMLKPAKTPQHAYAQEVADNVLALQAEIEARQNEAARLSAVAAAYARATVSELQVREVMHDDDLSDMQRARVMAQLQPPTVQSPLVSADIVQRSLSASLAASPRTQLDELVAARAGKAAMGGRPLPSSPAPKASIIIDASATSASPRNGPSSASPMQGNIRLLRMALHPPFPSLAPSATLTPRSAPSPQPPADKLALPHSLALPHGRSSPMTTATSRLNRSSPLPSPTTPRHVLESIESPKLAPQQLEAFSAARVALRDRMLSEQRTMHSPSSTAANLLRRIQSAQAKRSGELLEDDAMLELEDQVDQWDKQHQSQTPNEFNYQSEASYQFQSNQINSAQTDSQHSAHSLDEQYDNDFDDDDLDQWVQQHDEPPKREPIKMTASTPTPSKQPTYRDLDLSKVKPHDEPLPAPRGAPSRMGDSFLKVVVTPPPVLVVKKAIEISHHRPSSATFVSHARPSALSVSISGNRPCTVPFDSARLRQRPRVFTPLVPAASAPTPMSLNTTAGAISQNALMATAAAAQQKIAQTLGTDEENYDDDFDDDAENEYLFEEGDTNFDADEDFLRPSDRRRDGFGGGDEREQFYYDDDD